MKRKQGTVRPDLSLNLEFKNVTLRAGEGGLSRSWVASDKLTVCAYETTTTTLTHLYLLEPLAIGWA